MLTGGSSISKRPIPASASPSHCSVEQADSVENAMSDRLFASALATLSLLLSTTLASAQQFRDRRASKSDVGSLNSRSALASSLLSPSMARSSIGKIDRI